MRIKIKTTVYLLFGLVYAIVPAIIFALINGRTIPSVTITSTDVLVAFCFSFVPFVVGFLGGEMYVDDVNESYLIIDPTDPSDRKK